MNRSIIHRSAIVALAVASLIGAAYLGAKTPLYPSGEVMAADEPFIAVQAMRNWFTNAVGGAPVDVWIEAEAGETTLIRVPSRLSSTVYLANEKGEITRALPGGTPYHIGGDTRIMKTINAYHILIGEDEVAVFPLFGPPEKRSFQPIHI